LFSLEAISKTYSGSTRKAVDSLDLAIGDGEIFGFLGPNGAGKTTTIRILTGVIAPDTGRVSIDDIDLGKEALAAKARCGSVPDNPELWNRLKAREYLDFIGDVYGVATAERRRRIAELAGRFAIDDVLGASIGTFSRGMKQKLCVVGSLLHDPHNWILDEPMVGLDPQASFDLKELMRERATAGGCVFFSTHVLEVAEKLCDRIGVISGGRLLFTGSLEDLRALRAGAKEAGEAVRGESLERLFLDLVENGAS